MKYIKSSTLLVAWLVVTALCTSPVVLAGGTMKMASATINDVQHQWQKVFSQELAGRIGDEINVEIYPASQLGPIPQMAEGVVLGTIESFISPTAFLVPSNPKFKIYDAPGLLNTQGIAEEDSQITYTTISLHLFQRSKQPTAGAHLAP